MNPGLNIHPSPLRLGLQAIVTTTKACLVAPHGMTELAVPGGLSELTGEVRGQPVKMHTQSFTGSVWTRLVVSTIFDATGTPCTATVIGTPDPTTGMPILGMDLIAFGGALSLVAIDLAPTDEQRWNDHARPLLCQLHDRVEGQVKHRRWPSFAQDVFSPLALIAGVARGRESALFPAALEFIESLGAPLNDIGALDPARVAQAEHRIRAWEAAERQNRREHNALKRIFGPATSSRFLTYLFGDEKVPNHVQ
ncbi:MAG: hypothetical protein ACPG4T_14475 [Nannocystaceae bacterium]